MDGSEPSTFATLNHRAGSARWDHASSSIIVPGLIWLVLSWEESLFTLVVLSVIECDVLILSLSHSACSDSSDPGRIGCVTVLSLYWLHHRVVEVDHKVSVDLVLVR